jgi:tRNA(adenine34) deaminase
VEQLKDATAHAEMLALTQAEAAVGDWRLTDCTLYVTKEPCPMCAGAMVHTRLARVVYGVSDVKGGAAGGTVNLLQFPTLNHRCDITAGVREVECRDLLKNFLPSNGFQKRQKRKTANPVPPTLARISEWESFGQIEPAQIKTGHPRGCPAVAIKENAGVAYCGKL